METLISEDVYGCGAVQAALPEPVAPPAAEREEDAAAEAWKEEEASSP